MKVLMLSWEYPPHSVGGLGKHVMELVPALARAGARVDLVVPRLAGGDATEEIALAPGRGRRSARQSTVHRVDLPAGDAPDVHARAQQANLALEADVRQLWESNGPYDLLHAHDWLVGFAGVGLKHAFRVPLLTTIHATEYGRWRGWLGTELSQRINNTEWWLAYESWRVICCSRFMAREVEGALRTPPDKVDVIPNGVDTTRFDALDGEDLSAFRLGFAAPDQKIIFYVGRVTYEKGVHLLVEAMPHLVGTGRAVKLVVAGTGPDLARVRQLATDLGVGANCYFTGFIPDEVRDRLFRVADVAAFPSLYEPFGIVALEAMAARTPVVVSEVGGLAEVVQHAVTGITVFPDNVASLIWGITHTLDHPAWAQQRVVNAYRAVREDFNWDKIAEQTMATYRRIASEREAAVW